MGNWIYYYKHRSKILERGRVYNQIHQSERRLYLIENQDSIRKRDRDYYQRPYVKLKKKEQSMKWRGNNKEWTKEYNKKYLEDHQREHNLGNVKSYQKLSKNKKWLDKRNKRSSKWRKNNHERFIVMVHKSQTKMLKKLSMVMKIQYDKIPHFFRSWSLLVKKQMGNYCAICESTDKIESHHIFSIIKYPLLSLNINNGIPLCRKCHNQAHFKEVVYSG